MNKPVCFYAREPLSLSEFLNPDTRHKFDIWTVVVDGNQAHRVRGLNLEVRDEKPVIENRKGDERMPPDGTPLVDYLFGEPQPGYRYVYRFSSFNLLREHVQVERFEPVHPETPDHHNVERMDNQ